jgi:hypothetical protein
MWTTTANLTQKYSFQPQLNTGMFGLPMLCGGDPVEALAMMAAVTVTYVNASAWLMALLAR